MLGIRIVIGANSIITNNTSHVRQRYDISYIIEGGGGQYGRGTLEPITPVSTHQKTVRAFLLERFIPGP